MFRAAYGHCHSTAYGHCHSIPNGHCHSAPYRRSAVVMNVPGPRTASRQNDAAASHSCHFNTVLYPKSYSECQLPLHRICRDITDAAFSVTALSSLAPLQTCQHIYIRLYNVPP